MRLHRSLSAGNKRALILSMVATAVLSLLPISSHATVDWNDSFEYASDVSLGAVWEYSCLGNPGVSTDRAFSGSKSLKETFTGVAGVDPGAGGCFLNRYLPAPSDTIYNRFYMYMQNFTVNSTGTKITAHGPVSYYPSFWWMMNYGGAHLDVSVQGIILNDGTQGSVNIIGPAIPQNQWVCIETRLTMSSPGVDNGIVQAWINGTQVMNVTNQRMRAATLNQKNSPTAQFQVVSLYTQHGVGTIYYDDYALSRDARIGCSGSPAPASDTTPPTPPSGVLVR